ncbi:MAG TPA: hypothetical protein PLO33_19655 [Kouleothrix sp.]|mgnify:CR=1 FL=1|nr:hypothetical protein [Kouleothrix sp.]HRC77910.1 hypothetical protein [Kouleothrix sp.]
MPWSEPRQHGRYEIIFKDRPLHDATEARAQRAGMSIPEYLQALARAVVAMEQGDPILLSLLGITATPPPVPLTPAAGDPRLIDSVLDQFGL